LEAMSAVVNGCDPVSTIAASGFASLRYASQSGPNGMTASHLQAAVPYGRSARIMATEPEGISFMRSRQSPSSSRVESNAVVVTVSTHYPFQVAIQGRKERALHKSSARFPSGVQPNYLWGREHIG